MCEDTEDRSNVQYCFLYVAILIKNGFCAIKRMTVAIAMWVLCFVCIHVVTSQSTVPVNQAYRKSVVVDPPDGACGADKTRSQIEIPRDDLNPEYLYGDQFSGFNGDFGPQLITCATDCERKYPQNYEVFKLEGSDGDGRIMGSSDCTPFIELPSELLESRRKKRTTDDDPNVCEVTKSITSQTRQWSYSFWIKPETDFNGNLTILEHRELQIKLSNQPNFQAVITWLNNGNSRSMSMTPSEWSWMAIQYEEGQGARLYMFSGGFNYTIAVSGNTPSEQNITEQEKTTVINIGSSPINTEKCERLEISQCRKIHYSQSVQKGSQQRIQPRFPSLSRCRGLSSDEEYAITLYFCSSYYPACDVQGNDALNPCDSLCEEAVQILNQKCSNVGGADRLFQQGSIWRCQQRPRRQATSCISSSTQFENGLFRGIVRDFRIYPSMLTTRQLIEIVNKTFPVYYPNDECMCSLDQPASVDQCDITDPTFCYQLISRNMYQQFWSYGTLRTDAALPDNVRFFSSQYITDGRYQTTYGYWASTPGLEKVSLIIDFGKTIQVDARSGSFQLHLATPLPEDAIIINRFINGSWMAWQYFATNCEGLGLPNNGNPTTPDAVQCVRWSKRTMVQEDYDPREQPFVYGNFPPIVNDFSYRPGLYQGVLDERLRNFLLMEKIKVEFRGLPQGSAGSKEQQYHAVKEIIVHGSEFRDNGTCDIECFPNDWGSTERPSGDHSSTERPSGVTKINQTECLCMCREPFNREEAGPNCVPYTDVYPNYGPIIGGTVLTMIGALLGEETPTVILKNLPGEPPVSIPCAVKSSNDTRIECVTTMTIDDHVDQAFFVAIEHKADIQIKAKQLFTYKPDPEISDIYPLVSIVDGGIILTVEGTDLDSVTKPAMRVRIEYTKNNSTVYTNYMLCTVGNSTVMYCPTPNIYPYLPPEYQMRLNDDHTEVINITSDVTRFKRAVEDTQSSIAKFIAHYLPSLNLGNRNKREAGDIDPDEQITDENLQAYPEFRQDGLFTPTNISVRYVTNPPIYAWDPPVKDFRPEWPHNHDNIGIGGKRLDHAAGIDDYIVEIGVERCRVIHLLENLLTCEPPEFKPNLGDNATEDGTVAVTIYVGRRNIGSYRKFLGYLKYYAWWQSSEFIGAMIGMGLFTILMIVAICLFTRRRKNAKKHVNDNEYYVDGQSEVLKLNLINPYLRRRIERSLLKDPERLQIDKEIGSGNFGKVYSGQFMRFNNSRPVRVAVKTLKGNEDVSQIEELLEEALMMEEFKHPNIMSIIGISFQDNTPHVILPFMTNGDLRTYVKEPNNEFMLSDLLEFSVQIARGMAYLEQKRFVHRDLAARNCMVDTDKIVKVADFGLARDIYVDDYYKVEDRSRPLPVRWMAIECMELNKFTHKSDVWSFGVVMWELVTRGMQPYSGIDNLDIKRFLKRGDRLEKPPHVPFDVYEVMKKCWETKPKDRPMFSELVELLEPLFDGKESVTKRVKTKNIENGDYADMPREYLELVEVPTEKNVLSNYNRYSKS